MKSEKHDMNNNTHRNEGAVTDLFFCMFSRPTLYMFDKIVVEVGSKGGGEGARGPGR